MNFNPVQAGNPVAQSAQGLASLGRNNDKMLMHVTPNEVAGLQSLAQTLGGSLTVNPQTGLPEAGFFDGIGDFVSNLLPTIAGVGASFIPGVGPLGGAALATGLKTAQTGNLGDGILAGIGAYTGASTGADLVKFGAQGTSTALPTLADASSLASTTANIGQGGGFAEALGANPLVSAPVAQGGLGAATPGADLAAQTATAATPSFTDNLSNFASGIQRIGSEGLTPYAEFTGSSPLVAGAKLASPFVGAGLETLAQQQPMGLPDMSMGFGKFTPMQDIRARYRKEYGAAGGTPVFADGGMVDQKPYGVQNQQGITGLPIGQQTPPKGTFTGYNPKQGGLPIGSPEHNSIQSGVATQYKAGGLLNGPGDGVSDSIRANIEGKQEARLADGEFVVPARVVSEVGNGSTKAGAKKLYAWMDKVENLSKNRKHVAANTKADKYLPT